jgi:hypothetical protein
VNVAVPAARSFVGCRSGLSIASVERSLDTGIFRPV